MAPYQRLVIVFSGDSCHCDVEIDGTVGAEIAKMERISDRGKKTADQKSVGKEDELSGKSVWPWRIATHHSHLFHHQSGIAPDMN